MGAVRVFRRQRSMITLFSRQGLQYFERLLTCFLPFVLSNKIVVKSTFCRKEQYR